MSKLYQLKVWLYRKKMLRRMGASAPLARGEPPDSYATGIIVVK